MYLDKVRQLSNREAAKVIKEEISELNSSQNSDDWDFKAKNRYASDEDDSAELSDDMDADYILYHHEDDTEIQKIQARAQF